MRCRRCRSEGRCPVSGSWSSITAANRYGRGKRASYVSAGRRWRPAIGKPLDQTAARFQPPRCADAEGTRWYRTGDRAVMSSDHGLIILAALRQTKIRGHRAELLEVENAMRRAAGTHMVAAVPWPVGDDGLALGLVGFVAGSLKLDAEIIAACHDSLPYYMVPSQICRAIDWPLNANGKTDYTSLTRLLQNGDVEHQ